MVPQPDITTDNNGLVRYLGYSFWTSADPREFRVVRINDYNNTRFEVLRVDDGSLRRTRVKQSLFRADGKGRGFRPATAAELHKIGLDEALAAKVDGQ